MGSRQRGWKDCRGGVSARRFLSLVCKFNTSQNVITEEIICGSMQSSKNFLTFASENSLVVTLVSHLAKFDHHFFLDFIFH
jgi:hypothetical protein